MTQAVLTSDFLKKLPAAEDWWPKVGRHVTSRAIHMEGGKFLMCFRVMGMPFESVSDAVIETNYDTLTALISGLGRDHGNRLAIWTTFMRRKVRFDGRYEFGSNFAQEFADKYLERFRQHDYFENSFYISLVFKYQDFDDGLKEIAQLGDELYKSLRDYDPEYLETFDRNKMQFSRAYQFLGGLWNGFEEEMPVTAAPARELLPSSMLHFSYDTVEIRGDTRTRFATCYDLKDFPRAGWGQLNPLLSLPVEFTITQSFTCMTAFSANRAIGKQLNKLASVGDKAKHQSAELKKAQGYVSSGELAFGDYHGALVVYGDTARKAIDAGNLLTTRSKGECGFVWAKASLSAPYTYASQIPGSGVKPRPQPKSSRNLASSFTLHDYSSGKSKGNPIGDGSAVMPIQTVSKKLYNFNYHATRDDESNTGEKIAGHTLILGSTGVGKTALQLAIASFFERFNPMWFALDVGRGMEIWFRQMGATYIALEAGKPTGLSPFELPDTPQNRQFWYDLVTICAQDEEGKVTAEEQKQIKDAVDTIAALDDVRKKRFSRLLENITDEGGNGLHVRLSQWCASENGRYAWVFDNPPGSMQDITQQRRVAFDVTHFLKENYTPSEPIFAYLFYLKQLMQREGQLMMSIVEEFWLPIKYKKTREMIEAVLAAGRKAGEFLVLVTQQPEQAINSPVFPQIRSLTATKIFMPDPEAEYESYKRCNLTEKEFRELKKLGKSSRRFLIKQSNQSAFGSLDLYGFDDEMAVLSGTPENVVIMNEVIAAVGPDPDVWRGPFQERVFAAKLRAKLAMQLGAETAVIESMLEKGILERRELKAAEAAARQVARAQAAI